MSYLSRISDVRGRAGAIPNSIMYSFFSGSVHDFISSLGIETLYGFQRLGDEVRARTKFPSGSYENGHE